MVEGGVQLSTIRFIHAADLHLDSPFKGMTGLPIEQLTHLRESTFNAFTKLIDYALESKPDFILLVGDIYDGEDRSLRAQMRFQESMEKLYTAGIPVYILYGNHDHLGGRWTRFELPPNVHVFGGDVETVQFTINGHEVKVTGFSYTERHVRKVMIEQYPVAIDSDSFHIGMLHGSLAGDETHAVYAPFTKSELLAKHYDYWALGHIHLRQTLHDEPAIVYPGNLQGRHRNEHGIKGFYEVELSKSRTSLTFIPTSAIVFQQLKISCAGISHANEWLEICIEALDSFRAHHGSGIVELTMIDVDSEAFNLFNQSPVDEWLDVLREVVGEREPFVWVQTISFEREGNFAIASSALAQSVLSLMEEWTEDEWKLILKDVYQHARGIKYLDILDDDEIQEIKNSASSILMAEMSKPE